MSDKMREEFEAWHKAKYPNLNLETYRPEPDGYWHWAIHGKYIAWQSAYAAGRKAGMEEAARIADEHTYAWWAAQAIREAAK